MADMLNYLKTHMRIKYVFRLREKDNRKASSGKSLQKGECIRMKKVLFLGAPVFQIPVIEKAKQLGLYVGVVDINPEAMGVHYADEHFVCSLRDDEKLFEIAKQFKPDGIVIGACDTSVVSASRICQKLGLPGHSIDTAVKATDKLQMLLAFQAHHVAHPEFWLVNKNEIETFCKDITYPAISKPTDSSGSRGIYYIQNSSELKSALKYSSNAGRSGVVLIEEYMNGPEVSVEILVVNGVPYVLQITDKITSGPPYFYETGHSQPSALPEETKNRIAHLAKQACTAIGLENSPAHVEIKVTDNGPKMVEMGARLGGGCISTYLLDTSIKGICLSEEAIRMAMGMIPNVVSFTNSEDAVAVRFILAQEGTIQSITGVDEASKEDGVIKVMIYGTVGQHYKQTFDNASRMGFVVAKGKTTKEALLKCELAIKKIKIQYI